MATPKVGDEIFVSLRFKSKGIEKRTVIQISGESVIVNSASGNFGDYVAEYNYGLTAEECKQKLIDYKTDRIESLSKQIDKIEMELIKISKL